MVIGGREQMMEKEGGIQHSTERAQRIIFTHWCVLLRPVVLSLSVGVELGAGLAADVSLR